MKVVIQFTEKQEAKALPILYRHSPGMVLKERIHVLSTAAVYQLRTEGIRFKEATRDFGSLPLTA